MKCVVCNKKEANGGDLCKSCADHYRRKFKVKSKSQFFKKKLFVELISVYKKLRNEERNNQD